MNSLADINGWQYLEVSLELNDENQIILAFVHTK